MAATKLTRTYVLRDPRDGVVRYVGKTVGKLRQRLAAHVSDAPAGRTKCARWIAVLLAEGLRPEIEQIDSAGADWAEREAYWITLHRAQVGERLTNQAPGATALRA